MITIVSTSLREESRSRTAAREVAHLLTRLDQEAIILDMREYELPFCNGGGESTRSFAPLRSSLAVAKGVIFAVPIYNYDVNSVAKNFVELFGDALQGKVVGLIATAGGRRSHMAPLFFLNSLMLDFRSVIAPRYLYLDEEIESEDETRERLENFTCDFLDLATAVSGNSSYSREILASKVGEVNRSNPILAG